MAKNKAPKVVTKPTGKQGGTNASTKVVTKPTGKSGGVNAAAKVKPVKK